MLLTKGAFLPWASARSPLKTVHWTVFLALRTPLKPLRLSGVMGKLIQLFGAMVALMRLTPAEEDSSLRILKEPRSPVLLAWGPPQISKE